MHLVLVQYEAQPVTIPCVCTSSLASVLAEPLARTDAAPCPGILSWAQPLGAHLAGGGLGRRYDKASSSALLLMFPASFCIATAEEPGQGSGTLPQSGSGSRSSLWREEKRGFREAACAAFWGVEGDPETGRAWLLCKPIAPFIPSTVPCSPHHHLGRGSPAPGSEKRACIFISSLAELVSLSDTLLSGKRGLPLPPFDPGGWRRLLATSCTRRHGASW